MQELTIIIGFIASLCAFIGYRLTNSPYFLKNRIKDKNNLITDMFNEKEHWRQKYMKLARKEQINLDPEKAKDVDSAIPNLISQFAGADPRLAKLLNNPAAVDFALGLAKKYPKEAEQVISTFITKLPKGQTGQAQTVSRL